jgi:hypothetical protein
LQTSDRAQVAHVWSEVEQQVHVHSRAGKDADWAIVFLGIVTGVFESVRGALEEETVLRIGDAGFDGAEVEERSIK